MYREMVSGALLLPYFDYFRWDGKVEQLPSTLRKVLGTDRYQNLQATFRWLKHERWARSGVPLQRKLEMWRRGFFAESATILVDAEGVPVILEANGNSDVNLLQVHGGLLSEPEIRRFYQRVGVI